MSEPYRPIVVAHRGLHDALPENSLGAFRRAGRAGVPWIECDVWPSGDPEPLAVVLHDETLDRTTTGSGPVWSRTWEVLGSVCLRHPDGRPDAGERLPPLLDLLGAMEAGSDGPKAATPGGLPVGMLVEIKPPDSVGFVRLVVGRLRQYGGPWMAQSFDEANLIHALAFDVGTPVAFLVEGRDALDRGIANGWKNIHLHHHLLDEPTARRLRAAGVSVGVWTPNTADDLRGVMDLRADMIITDEPVLAMDLLRRRR